VTVQPGTEPDAEPLLALFASCVVPIDADGGFRGTGFLVAPGEVLTCAHVVHGGQAITVTTADGMCCAAEVVSPLLAPEDPAARFYPLPDTALLRLATAPAEHPCVRLDLTEPVVTPWPDVFRLDAYTRGEHAEDAVVHSGAALEYELPLTEEGWRLYKLRDGQVIGGFSGGPLLNRRTGGVCAVVDSSRGELGYLGGFGVPMAAVLGELPGLRERNEAFHKADPRWQRALEDEAQRAAERAARREGLPVRNNVQQPTWEAVAPRQLPGAVRHFTGRVDELKALSVLLEKAGPGRTVVISAINGTAGIGKTALAVYWAHQVAQQFPDGQLYVNLRGFDPSGSPVKPAAAIRDFLDTFAVPVDRIPRSLEAQAALYRSLLAERRVLVVLDNARDVDQVRPLLPGSPTCLVVVTSRSRLSGLAATEGAHPLTLDLLSIAGARELLACHVGAERVAGEAEAVDELISLSARLPLALAIMGARASEHPGFSLKALVAQFRDAEGWRLDALDGRDLATNVRAVFSWSYRYLSAWTARMFRLLGVHPGPDISLPAAASMAAIPLKQARQLLSELIDAGMVTEHAPGRFAFHDLLRAYATDRAHTEDGDVKRLAAVHRLLDHYLHTAYTAAMLLHSTRDPLTLAPPQPGVAPEEFVDEKQALAWFEAEHPVLLKVIAQAAETGFDDHAWQIPWILATFLDRWGHWQDWASTQHTALASAKRLGNRDAQAQAHRLLGRAYLRLGSIKEAETHLRHALDLFQKLANGVGQAHAHNHLASVLERQGRNNEALDQVQQALDLYQTAGHQIGQARALNTIGWYQALLGNHDEALTFCGRALTLSRELGYRLGEAATLDSLGTAHQYLGHHPQSLAYYQQALGLWRELRNRYYEATTLTHLGDTRHATGDRESACDTWRQALIILDDLHHPDADKIRAKLDHLKTT